MIRRDFILLPCLAGPLSLNVYGNNNSVISGSYLTVQVAGIRCTSDIYPGTWVVNAYG
jgi:hypothetical protein